MTTLGHDRFLRQPAVLDIVNISGMHLRRLEKAGKFPKRIKLNPGSGAQGAVGWLESEVMEWLKQRKRAPREVVVEKKVEQQCNCEPVAYKTISYATQIDDLLLPARVFNVVAGHMGLEFALELAVTKDREFLEHPNFGEQSLQDLRRVIPLLDGHQWDGVGGLFQTYRSIICDLKEDVKQRETLLRSLKEALERDNNFSELRKQINELEKQVSNLTEENRKLNEQALERGKGVSISTLIGMIGVDGKG